MVIQRTVADVAEVIKSTVPSPLHTVKRVRVVRFIPIGTCLDYEENTSPTIPGPYHSNLAIETYIESNLGGRHSRDNVG
ncbi:hypothetical protein TNCV_3185981 [Trichonephila clavipes]|nr:hypothetical protein TNCV_3185981 [Trichonephila clavipes]